MAPLHRLLPPRSAPSCLALHPAVAQDKPRDCSAPTELVVNETRLPLLAEQLKQRKPVTIVAIGGSSTAGAAAQSPDLAYPERLAAELARRYPGASIKVVNKGVPRRPRRRWSPAFPRDCFAEDPVLAIWETGTNRGGARHGRRGIRRDARYRHSRPARPPYLR